MEIQNIYTPVELHLIFINLSTRGKVPIFIYILPSLYLATYSNSNMSAYCLLPFHPVLFVATMGGRVGIDSIGGRRWSGGDAEVL